MLYCRNTKAPAFEVLFQTPTGHSYKIQLKHLIIFLKSKKSWNPNQLWVIELCGISPH